MLTVGVKYDADKLRYDLVPTYALKDIVAVLTHGAKKYAPDNWRKVDDLENRYFAAAMRHMEAWRQGTEMDEESGLPHLAHAATCLIYLLAVRKV
jgi:hypothetical protein